jgi:hypothetical protein
MFQYYTSYTSWKIQHCPFSWVGNLEYSCECFQRAIKLQGPFLSKMDLSKTIYISWRRTRESRLYIQHPTYALAVCCYCMIYACVFLVSSHFRRPSPLFLRLKLSMGLQWPLTLSKLRSADNPRAQFITDAQTKEADGGAVCVAKCGVR